MYGLLILIIQHWFEFLGQTVLLKSILKLQQRWQFYVLIHLHLIIFLTISIFRKDLTSEWPWPGVNLLQWSTKHSLNLHEDSVNRKLSSRSLKLFFFRFRGFLFCKEIYLRANLTLRSFYIYMHTNVYLHSFECFFIR